MQYYKFSRLERALKFLFRNKFACQRKTSRWRDVDKLFNIINSINIDAMTLIALIAAYFWFLLLQVKLQVFVASRGFSSFLLNKDVDP